MIWDIFCSAVSECIPQCSNYTHQQQLPQYVLAHIYIYIYNVYVADVVSILPRECSTQ